MGIPLANLPPKDLLLQHYCLEGYQCHPIARWLHYAMALDSATQPLLGSQKEALPKPEIQTVIKYVYVCVYFSLTCFATKRVMLFASRIIILDCTSKSPSLLTFLAWTPRGSVSGSIERSQWGWEASSNIYDKRKCNSNLFYTLVNCNDFCVRNDFLCFFC